MDYPSKSAAQSSLRDDLLATWRAGVMIDGSSDPFDAVLQELSAYFGISQEEAKERCLNWTTASIEEWNARPRDTPEGLLDFYQTQQSWIFDTMWYHAQQCGEDLPPESVMIAERLHDVAPGQHLDFGAGPGTTSIFFHRLGWKVSLADISTTLQDFARWRLPRHGVEATYYNTAKETLPADAFDLITACDVMVHIPDPAAALRALHRSLKVGGYLIFNVDARPEKSQDTEWHLFPYAYPVLRPVRAIGFSREPRLEFFHVYRKIDESSSARVAAVSVYDALRYNYAMARVGREVRPLLARLRQMR